MHCNIWTRAWCGDGKLQEACVTVEGYRFEAHRYWININLFTFSLSYQTTRNVQDIYLFLHLSEMSRNERDTWCNVRADHISNPLLPLHWCAKEMVMGKEILNTLMPCQVSASTRCCWWNKGKRCRMTVAWVWGKVHVTEIPGICPACTLKALSILNKCSYTWSVGPSRGFPEQIFKIFKLSCLQGLSSKPNLTSPLINSSSLNSLQFVKISPVES